jgi:hypothetical protein
LNASAYEELSGILPISFGMVEISSCCGMLSEG